MTHGLPVRVKAVWRGEIDMLKERQLATKGPQVVLKFTFRAKKVVDDCWIGPGRTMILGRMDRQNTGGKSAQPAKLKGVTQRFVRIIVKTAASLRNVEVQWDWKMKRVLFKDIGVGRILKPAMESN